MSDGLLRLQDLQVQEPVKFSKLWESNSLAAVARAVAVKAQALAVSDTAAQVSQQHKQTAAAGLHNQPNKLTDQLYNPIQQPYCLGERCAAAKSPGLSAELSAVTNEVTRLFPAYSIGADTDQTLMDVVLTGDDRQQQVPSNQNQIHTELQLQACTQNLCLQNIATLALPQLQQLENSEGGPGTTQDQYITDALVELHNVALQQAADASSVAALGHINSHHCDQQQTPDGGNASRQQPFAVRFTDAFSHQLGQLLLADRRSHFNSFALFDLFVEAAAAGIPVHDMC